MTTKKKWTLVIHAPQHKAKRGATSFAAILAGGVGPGYIIYKSDKSKLQIPGSTVVLLDNDLKRRAEGVLVKLHPGAKAGNGQQRYDVHVAKWTVVPYQRQKLNRCGVAVIGC